MGHNLGDLIESGGVEYVVTAKGYISIVTGDVQKKLTSKKPVKLIRRAFGLEIKENN